MRAMVQLPTYLERVLSGGRDLALVLLPSHDLRSVRGSPCCPKGRCCSSTSSPTAGATAAAAGRRTADNRSPMGAPAAAALPDRLLGYIRGERTVQNLEILAKVAESWNRSQPPNRSSNWVGGGRSTGGGAGERHRRQRTLKRLLARPTGRSRCCTRSARRAIARVRRSTCLNNLLYYIARASAAAANRRGACVLQACRAPSGRRYDRRGARESVRASVN